MSSDLDLRALPAPGDLFDLEYVIGTGTYGEVFKAMHKKTKQTVAVKILDLIEDEEEEIKVEVHVLKFLSHPNIPTFYGAFLAGPDPKSKERHPKPKLWLAMEFCDLGSITDLAEELGPKTIPEPIIAYVLRQTTEALHYLHDNCIIHRDVKGQNILITGKGDIKILDFGVSGILRDKQELRNTYIGTPYWMAPEVIACDQQPEAVYDTRSDIWSLGITGIEIAEKEPPTANLHPMRALYVIPRNPPPTLKENKWSELFKDFLAKCLIKDFYERPTASDLMEHAFVRDVDVRKQADTLVDLVMRARNKSKKRTSAGQFRDEDEDEEEVVVEDPAAVDRSDGLRSEASSAGLEESRLEESLDLPIPENKEIFKSHKRKSTAMSPTEPALVAGLSRNPDAHNRHHSDSLGKPAGKPRRELGSNFVSTSQAASSFLGPDRHAALPDATMRPARRATNAHIPGFGVLDSDNGGVVVAESEDYTRPEIRKYKRQFTTEILCSTFWGTNLVVGSRAGLYLLDKSEQHKVLPLISGLRFNQIDILESLGIMVARCSRKNKMRMYSLQFFKQQLLGKPARGLKRFIALNDLQDCVHYKLVRHERYRFLVVAQKKRIIVFLWAPKPYQKFMLFKDLAVPVQPLFVDAYMSSFEELKVVFASRHGFHKVDLETGVVADLLEEASIPQTFVPVGVVPLKDEQLFLAFNSSGIVLDDYGDVIHEASFNWEAQPDDIVYGHPDQIIAWSSKQIEIRSLQTGQMCGIFRHKRSTKIKMLSCRENRIYFSVTRPRAGTQVYFMIF